MRKCVPQKLTIDKCKIWLNFVLSTGDKPGRSLGLNNSKLNSYEKVK